MIPTLASVRLGSFAAIVAAGLGLSPAQAAPALSLDVPSMVAEADLIVVGRAEAVRLQGGTANPALALTVRIDRVVKGQGSPHAVAVRFALGRSTETVSSSQYGQFFLRRASGGVYAPVNLNYPVLPAVPGSTTASANPLADVARELARVLVIDQTPDAQRAAERAAEALLTIPYAKAAAALRAAAATDGAGRIWAAGVLFFVGDDERFDAIKVRHLDSVKDTLIEPAPEAERAVSMLAVAMQGRLASPKAIPTLAAILRSRRPDVRRAAAAVLGEIGSPRAVKPLALALGDEDTEVRSLAVSGLADILSKGPYDPADESAALAYWRRWARANLR